jgi:type I restriction enzyme, S subunit
MGGEWHKTTWGELATLEYGKALREYEDVPKAARVFGTNGPIGWNDQALWEGPGVIVGRKGAYRGVHYTDGPYWVIDTAYSLHPKAPINLRWAYYALRSIDLNAVDDGSPIPSTTRPAFYALSVMVPPRKEQDQIANILSGLDDKIELNRRMAETLEAIARALFKSWFVDFDPVRAKAEGRPTGLPDDLAVLFPDCFDENGIPAGWEIKSIEALVEVNPRLR